MPVRRRILLAVLATLLAAVGASLAWRRFAGPAPIVIALADSLSGPISFAGNEDLVATRIYLDEVNAAGGIDGHMLRLALFDDQSKPATAQANAAAVLASPAVAVLGHYLSAASLAAGPLYRAGRIAAVTGTASADAVTQGNPYYFRPLTPASDQAEFLAGYIRNVLRSRDPMFLRSPEVNLVVTDDTYGRSFRAGFVRGHGGEPKTFVVRPDAPDGSAAATAELLAHELEPRVIILGTSADQNAPMLKAIRRRGIHAVVMLGSGAGADSFAAGFDAEPEERDTPGFFTGNAYAIAPIILDNTGALGRRFEAQYEAATGKRASWIAAAAEDAARLLVEAVRRARLSNTAAARAEDRERVAQALAGIGTEARAVEGINGALYFNTARDMPRAMHMGLFRQNRFISAPLQLVRVGNTGLVDIQREVDQDHMVQIDRDFYWLQRVVYTGIDITHLNRIDIREGTFSADFYLWMRYAGSDDIPERISFPDLLGAFDAEHPLQAGTDDGLNYRLYRVSGTFKADFDLRDYPFDTQSLLVRLQNRDHPREEISYVIDTFGLQLDRVGAQPPDHDEAFRGVQLWQVTGVRPFVDSFSIRSTLGKTGLFSTLNRSNYGGFDTEVTLQRRVGAFMVKTLLPLFLLVLVVFATLFFPPSFAKERTTIPVTGILTSAVLLSGISSQLPALGYTVALEYVFYVFFALCLMAMVTGFLSEILRHQRVHRHAVAVDLFGRIIYVATVAATIGVFWWKYGPTFA